MTIIKELFSTIKKNKINYFLTTLLLTTSLVSLGVGLYYAKNTNSNIHYKTIKDNESSLVDLSNVQKISDDEVSEFESVFSKENIYKSIDTQNLHVQIYSRNIDHEGVFQKLKILDTSDDLSYIYGTKPLSDNEVSLTDFAIRYFYNYGLKNIYNEVSSEDIRKDQSLLIGKFLVTDFGTLKISGIIDTDFTFSSYDSNNDSLDFNNLIENSIVFNENVTQKINYLIRNIKKIVPFEDLLSYTDRDNQFESLNYVHVFNTYKDYVYNIKNDSDESNDIYLSGPSISHLIQDIGIGDKEVTLAPKFNFGNEELNSNLKLDSFFEKINEYILEFTATKYYQEAYSRKNFDIYTYENKLNKQGPLEEIDKKNAYKLFLNDVYNFGIEYDNFFDENPHYFKINECALELVEYLFNEYPELSRLLDQKIKYRINGEEGLLNFKGVNLTSGYYSPVSVLSKEIFDKFGFSNNIYSSIHIKKEVVLSNFNSFMNLLNENKDLEIFNNKTLNDAIWLYENSYFICKVLLFSLSGLTLIATFVIYIANIKNMFIVKKIHKDNNYKNIILYSSGVISFGAILSLVLLPFFTCLANLILFNVSEVTPLFFSGIPGIEYLFVVLDIIAILLIGVIILVLFNNKTNKYIFHKEKH